MGPRTGSAMSHAEGMDVDSLGDGATRHSSAPSHAEGMDVDSLGWSEAQP